MLLRAPLDDLDGKPFKEVMSKINLGNLLSKTFFFCKQLLEKGNWVVA